MRLVAVHNWPERYGSVPRADARAPRLRAERRGRRASVAPIEVPDVFADPSLDDWQEVATELGFRSFVALPLQTAQGVLGTVTFYFASPAR